MATRQVELTWREKCDFVSEYNVISSVLVIKNKTIYLTIETYHSVHVQAFVVYMISVI